MTENRRKVDRKALKTPLKAKLRIEIDAEVSDISAKGIAIRFSASNQESLERNSKLMLHLDMNGRLVSLEGTVRQVIEKDGTVTVGLEYDREQLAVFSST